MASGFMDGDYVPRHAVDWESGTFTDACFDSRNENLRLLLAAFPDFCLDGTFPVPWWLQDETGDDVQMYSYVGLAKLAVEELPAPRLLECVALLENEQAHRLWKMSHRRAWVDACLTS